MIDPPEKASRLRRFFSLRTAMIVVVVIVLLFPYLIVGVLSSDNHKLLESNRQLIDQLIDAGEKPIITDPEEVTQGEGTIIGPTGVQGERGPAGEDGRDATDAQVREGIAAYCDARFRCQGPAGADGIDGSPGSNGVNGSDGQNGAQGVPGPAGPQGELGPAGPQGIQGEPGPVGPAPASFSFTFLGVPYTCTNTGTGDYTCTVS